MPTNNSNNGQSPLSASQSSPAPVHAAMASNINAPQPPTSPSFSPKFSRSQKNILGGVIALTIIIGGAAAGSILVQRKTEAPKASSNLVDIALNAPSTANPGDSITVDVIITTTNTLSMTAADITFDYDTNVFTLDSISNGNVFQATPQQYATNEDSTQPLNGIELLNKPTQARFAVGAVCDQCYLGSPDSNHPEILECNSNITPQCYPKVVTNSTANNLLARATFTVKQNAPSGNTTINLANAQVAALSQDSNNAIGDVSAATVEIASNNSNPIQACDYNLNSDSAVNIIDVSMVAADFGKSASSSNYDFNSDGTVNIIDVSMVASYFGTSCAN